jgi:hypothetical protein
LAHRATAQAVCNAKNAEAPALMAPRTNPLGGSARFRDQ